MDLFSDQKDVGLLLHPGSASFDRKTKTYTLSASGENMWAAKDAFHFLFSQFNLSSHHSRNVKKIIDKPY